MDKLTEAEQAVLKKLDEAGNTLGLDLTDEEEDISDDLRERGYVAFYDDGVGYGSDILVHNPPRKRSNHAI